MMLGPQNVSDAEQLSVWTISPLPSKPTFRILQINSEIRTLAWFCVSTLNCGYLAKNMLPQYIYPTSLDTPLQESGSQNTH
jgi:hypothetical protein